MRLSDRCLFVGSLLLVTFQTAWARPHIFPYQQAGLNAREASAHLLNRLAFGPRPGEVDQVAAEGLEQWVESQFKSDRSNADLDRLLASIPEDSNDERLKQRKLLRAVYSPNQVREVMTDFWFNHFNVSLSDGDTTRHVPSYERDAISLNALSTFGQLLHATAHHPAMLYYLDNAYSTVEVTQPSEPLANAGKEPMGYNLPSRNPKPMMVRPKQGGLNENYARELLELHTLGVDGGYRQADVREVARAFTGWTVSNPSTPTTRGVFIFRPENHDAGTKRVLYSNFQPDGQKEGERILDLLAGHSSTAKFIAHKLAVRFVSDHPPGSVEETLRKAFQRSGGDTKQVLFALLESPEFWSREALRSKVKTPFELQASALRISGAKLEVSSGVVQQLSNMGQDCYNCRPPTGWPDRADFWISPGNMLNRMGFALDLAENRLGGAAVKPRSLLPDRLPDTPEQVLSSLAAATLPGRDLRSTEDLLRQAVLDPDYVSKVREARKQKGKLPKAIRNSKKPEVNDAQLAKTLGLLLGSPEFQRR
jgi:uncharacterized protein (DUF1800 family)